MKLSYVNQPDDVVELIRYQVTNNAGLKRRRTIGLIVYPLTVLIVSGLLSLWRDQMVWLIGGLVASLALILLQALVFRMLPKRLYEMRKAKGELPGNHKKYTLTVKKSGILVSCGQENRLHPWSEYTQAIERKEHLLLFNKQGSAHVVPRRDLGSEDFERFAAVVKQHVLFVTQAGKL